MNFRHEILKFRPAHREVACVPIGPRIVADTAVAGPAGAAIIVLPAGNGRVELAFAGMSISRPGDHPFSDLKLVLRGPEAPAFVHLLLCTLDVMERPSGVRRAELDFGHLSATAVWQGDEAAIKIAGLSAPEGDLRLTIQRREGVQQVVETLRELVEDSMSLPLTRQLRDS